MIFDTNVLIYLSKNILKIENLITTDVIPYISIISYIEAMGYPFSTNEDQLYMHKICTNCHVLFLSDQIVSETIDIRKKNRVKLPDAIIYATALVENLPLLTNNVVDFKSLESVELINPFTL